MKDNPQAAEGLLNRLAPKFRELEATEHSQPELFKLKVEDVRAAMTLQETARSWREAPRQERDRRRQASGPRGDQRASWPSTTHGPLREQELKMLENRIGEASEIDDMAELNSPSANQ